MIGLRAAGAALTALTLAGCAGGASLLGGETSPAPEVAMPGRWILSVPKAPVCGMMFSGDPKKPDGAIVPEGGCPERFFLSRRWSLQQGTLKISDDNDNLLATLSLTGGRFEGKSNADTPVTLTR
jgi:hypothetical protein